MGSRKAKGWWRVLATGLVAASILVAPSFESVATEVPSGDIMIIAAHPDDDIITAAGVIKTAYDAGQDVKVVYVTHGDEYDASIGTTRQNEGVAAQAILGVPETALMFFGYPATFLDCIRYNQAIPEHCDAEPPYPAFLDLHTSETYASRGMGTGVGVNRDYHYQTFGSHATFTQANIATDLEHVINANRPDHIYTHARFDLHPDHKDVWFAVMEAVDAIQDGDPSYDPTIHAAIVHPDDPDYPNAWPEFSPASPSLPHTTPNYSASLYVSPVSEWDLLGVATDGEFLWDHRESYAVPGSMLTTNSGSNDKYLAIAAHDTQFYDTLGLIQRFIHSDEVFWRYKVGDPSGVADSYGVDEGGTLNVGGVGVLANDFLGTGIPPGAPADPQPLGAFEASLAWGPSHGSLTTWDSDGSFVYVHDGSENFSDSFAYQPKQGSTYGAYTTVTIDITPIDEDPTADNDGPFNTANGEAVSVTAPGVLDGDSDPEGESLTAHLVDDVDNGTLVLNSNGSFTYTHDGSSTLSDSFTYVAKDPGSNSSNVATVSLTIDAADNPLLVDVSGPATGAQGVNQTYTAAVTGGQGSRHYTWEARRNGAVVASSTATSFSFAPASSGDYEIRLTVTDSSGSASDNASLKALGDIATSAFVNDIIWLADAGITQGCNPPVNDQFCPEDYVTRGQMAAFLVRFLGLTDDGGGDLFIDDDGSVFEANIDKLATAGITRGCNPAGTMFCPDDRVTRGQMAAFLVRALGLTDDGGGDLFVDDDDSIFESNIDKLATAGVTRGCNPPANTNFCPDGLVTRGQMAAFLHRAAGLISS